MNISSPYIIRKHFIGKLNNLSSMKRLFAMGKDNKYVQDGVTHNDGRRFKYE